MVLGLPAKEIAGDTVGFDSSTSRMEPNYYEDDADLLAQARRDLHDPLVNPDLVVPSEDCASSADRLADYLNSTYLTLGGDSGVTLKQAGQEMVDFAAEIARSDPEIVAQVLAEALILTELERRKRAEFLLARTPLSVEEIAEVLDMNVDDVRAAQAGSPPSWRRPAPAEGISYYERKDFHSLFRDPSWLCSCPARDHRILDPE